MTGGHPVAGDIQAFAALTPILPGRERALRSDLRSMAGDSPFANVPGTHFARWVLVTRLPYDGPAQKPDILKSRYLLFSTCFDGTDLGAHLALVRSGLGTAADRVWGHCVGYGGTTDLVRYLLHNRLDLAAVFAEYPEASVAEITAALGLRSRLVRFVLDHPRGTDAATLRHHWDAAFPSARQGARP